MHGSLDRFITAQERDYDTALKEIKNGYKCSHWMWYIFPQIAGLGHSFMAKQYEIADLEEAKSYIENDYLREHLLEITKALLLCENDDIEDIMGYPDNLKLRSCMTLFEFAAPQIPEFSMVLDRFYGGKRDVRTIAIIQKDR